jgi:precorrin isomerase
MEQTERVDKVMAVLNDSILRIAAQAETFRRRANLERRYHMWFSASLAVLGVAAPTLVTYQARFDNSILQIPTILLVAIAGAAGALQAAQIRCQELQAGGEA